MSQLSAEVSARELTVLAWRRTALRWVAVAVVAARIFTDTIGPAVVVVAFVTIAVAVALSLAAARENPPDALLKPALRLGVVVVGTLALGVSALVWVLAQ